MKLRWKAATVSASLSALFLIVYSTCNWITSHRDNIGSLHLDWERHIPFIPLLILPYMSIDLFFIAAPFLARSERELRTLANRLAAAILIAGAFFLLFPLKFAFERPHVYGPLGLIFNNFRTVDLPFNEFPSLHVALCLILLDIYCRHTTQWLRALVMIWFALILASTVFTYQHHLVDVVGGMGLALVCFYAFRNRTFRQALIPNPHIAIYYATGAILFCILAFCFTPWSYSLLWPACTLGITAAAYLTLGPGIFRKEAGEIPWSVWFILWPTLLGQRLSLMHYARRCQPYDRLTEHVWIGRRLSAIEASTACADGVKAVVDLAGELEEPEAFRKANYLSLSVLDLTAPCPEQIDRAVAFIQQQIAHGIVYIHCKAGYSRTAVIAGAYLLASGRADTVEAAIAAMRRARPSMIVRPEALNALRDYFRRHAPRPAPSPA
jgi:protein-tyrosine phosphatase/membrane-associated phospholipid phosphatase